MESASAAHQPRCSGTFDRVDKLVGQLPDYVRQFTREFVDAVMEMKRARWRSTSNASTFYRIKTV